MNYQDGIDTKGFVSTKERLLFETRLYSTLEESAVKFILWVITFIIGVAGSNEQSAIPNIILMSGAYLIDIYLNKLRLEYSIRFKRVSKIWNMLLFIIIVANLIIGFILLVNETIHKKLFVISLVLCVIMASKPLLDFIILYFNPNSSYIQYIDLEESEQKGMESRVPLDDSYKKDLEKTGTEGNLTDLK